MGRGRLPQVGGRQATGRAQGDLVTPGMDGAEGGDVIPDECVPGTGSFARPFALSVDAWGSSFSVGGVQAHSQRGG